MTFHVPELTATGSKDWGKVFRLVSLWLKIHEMHTKSIQNHWETLHFQAASQEREAQQGTWVSRTDGSQKKAQSWDLLDMVPQS